jgi:hypothetical protein
MIALVGAFAAVAISVVDARDGLDAAVEDSFDARLAQLAPPKTRVEPLGCRKIRVNFYDCTAKLRPLVPRAPRRAVTARYVVWLQDGGCWTTTNDGRVPLPPGLANPRGCIER